MPQAFGNTHASKRRQLAQEALRRSLKGGTQIKRLHEIANEIKDCADEFELKKLTAEADLRMKKLSKVLPTPRSVDVSVTQENEVTRLLKDIRQDAIEGEVVESVKANGPAH